MLHNFAGVENQTSIIYSILSIGEHLAGRSRLSSLLDRARITLFSASNTAYRRGAGSAVVVTTGLSGESTISVQQAVSLLSSQSVTIRAIGVDLRGDTGVRALGIVSGQTPYASATPSIDVNAAASSLTRAVSCELAPATTPIAPLLCVAGVEGCSCASNCELCALTTTTRTCARCIFPSVLFNGACVQSCPAGFDVNTVTATDLRCRFQCDALDLTIVLDASGSIAPELFEQMKMFAGSLVTYLPISPVDTQ